MAFLDLRDYIDTLEEKGLLKRIKEEVDPNLEITEILDRAVKQGGPAIIFENVKGHDIPVVGNLFGTMERVKLALGAENLEGIGEEIAKIMSKVPITLKEKISEIYKIKNFLSFMPRIVKKAPCQEIVLRGEKASLDTLPIPKCWPKDGGRYITLPLVFTKDIFTGKRNIGIYRMQVFDERTTGMHWHVHKHGAEHYRKAEKENKKLDVAVALGSDPATIFSAMAPLPEWLDEVVFSGFLRKKSVELVKCKTIDMEVPANSEIVLEGYVNPGEKKIEGPFGDHTGYYSSPDLYPVFHIKCITMRKNPIYPSTIVGIPPMEDAYMGKAIERIFLPILKLQLPEVVDINFPIESVFHNFTIVSIKKRYPGHAKKVMFALWGMDQMMFTKAILVLDADVNVQDTREVLWAASTRIDPKRDVIILEDTPMDTLDHATPFPNLGSKIGIDATRKLKEEGFDREWPEEVKMNENIKKIVKEKFGDLFK